MVWRHLGRRLRAAGQRQTASSVSLTTEKNDAGATRWKLVVFAATTRTSTIANPSVGLHNAR